MVRFFLAAIAAFLMFLRAAVLCFSLGFSLALRSCAPQWRLKNWMARSCALAFSREEKVPRLRLLPVLMFFLREYKRYSSDFSLRIMHACCLVQDLLKN
jgi:hypothetical protein